MNLYIDGRVKSWMDYRCITNVDTKNYKISHSATPDSNGFMKYKGMYCIALGSYYGGIGDIFKITFEDGKTIKCIKTDGKSDRHTDATHSYCIYDNSVIEFIVDSNALDEKCKLMGDCDSIFHGRIIKIERKK